jgi:hypothetical protein
VSTSDIPWEWRWWRAWLWVCGRVKGQIRVKEAWRRSAADRQKGEPKENGVETTIGRWTGGKWTQMRMEWRGGERKVTQTLGDGRAGRDDIWRRMENEGRREERMRRSTSKKPETETIDIVGTEGRGRGRDKHGRHGGYTTRSWGGTQERGRHGNTYKRRGRGRTQEMEKWGIKRYCREMRIDIWEGA